MAQEPGALRAERDGWGRAGYRNSMAGVGPSGAENHCRESMPPPPHFACYSTTVRLFPASPRRDAEINFI